MNTFSYCLSIGLFIIPRCFLKSYTAQLDVYDDGYITPYRYNGCKLCAFILFVYFSCHHSPSLEESSALLIYSSFRLGMEFPKNLEHAFKSSRLPTPTPFLPIRMKLQKQVIKKKYMMTFELLLTQQSEKPYVCFGTFCT